MTLYVYTLYIHNYILYIYCTCDIHVLADLNQERMRRSTELLQLFSQAVVGCHGIPWSLWLNKGQTDVIQIKHRINHDIP